MKHQLLASVLTDLPLNNAYEEFFKVKRKSS